MWILSNLEGGQNKGGSTALMFDLWCNCGDYRRGIQGIWDWVVLKGGIWKAHGKDVANTAPWFPRSFDHIPHNPAEKLSSGYKAWEPLVYFYGLGPALAKLSGCCVAVREFWVLDPIF